MGREIKHVPLDFDWPLSKVWKGFLRPDSLHGIPCPDCRTPDNAYPDGHSPEYRHLYALWYGNAPFRPEDNGSEPFAPEHPVIWAKAERNVKQDPRFYGWGEWAIRREAQRLADHYNNAWMHHLSQDDVDTLLAEYPVCLRELTHQWVKGSGWQPIDPAPVITAKLVNEWSLDPRNYVEHYHLIKARCEKAGKPISCASCDGHGETEAYPGQFQDSENWEPTEPPEGDGWQLWETVSEGSPISPVFTTAEELAQWMTTPAYSWGASKHSQLSYEGALAFVKAGWAPSGMTLPGRGFVDGVQAIGELEKSKKA